jgi:hypothetical protein
MASISEATEWRARRSGECRLDDALSYRGNVTVISHSDPLVPIAWCLSAGSSHWRGSIVALAVSSQIDTLISMAAKAAIDVFLIDLSPALSRQRDQFDSISAKTV